jgi:hypothetical protein
LETKLPTETLVKEAISFFVNTFGLKITNQEENSICFEGGGGQVTIVFCPGTKTNVEIETQEWDNIVREFMTKIRK